LKRGTIHKVKCSPHHSTTQERVSTETRKGYLAPSYIKKGLENKERLRSEVCHSKLSKDFLKSIRKSLL